MEHDQKCESRMRVVAEGRCTFRSMGQVLIGAGVALGSVVLAWFLNNRSTSSREVKARQRVAAEEWSTALVEVWMALDRHASAEKVEEARAEFLRAWLRFSGRVPVEVAERVEPLNLLLLLFGSADTRKPGEEGIAGWIGQAGVILRAFQSALAALDSCVLGQALPPRTFATTDEMHDKLVDAPKGSDLGVLQSLLNDLPSPPDARRMVTHLR